jgi:surface antigen
MRLRQVTLAVSIVAIGTIFGSIDAKAVQCAIFARGETGVDLYGDAWRWWGQAERAYARGAAPKPGALLVFKRANGMQHGHVAVVTKVLGSREIRVDHANWNHGRISRSIAVIDASPKNDWSLVRVKLDGISSYGRGNPSYGFIYPERAETHQSNTDDESKETGDAALAERLTTQMLAARIEAPESPHVDSEPPEAHSPEVLSGELREARAEGASSLVEAPVRHPSPSTGRMDAEALNAAELARVTEQPKTDERP